MYQLFHVFGTQCMGNGDINESVKCGEVVRSEGEWSGRKARNSLRWQKGKVTGNECERTYNQEDIKMKIIIQY